MLYEKKNIVGLVSFIIILDNEGKRIYSKYYVDDNNELASYPAQKEFEKRLCHSVVNYNVNKNDESKLFVFFLVDIFNLLNFMVVSRINKEVAVFVGANEHDNESVRFLLIYKIISNFFEVFIETLDIIVNKSFHRRGLLENYQKVSALVDEMVDNGIIINTDGENLEDKVLMKEKDEGTTYFGGLLNAARFGLRGALGGK